MYNKKENGAQRGIPGSKKYLNFGTGYLPELSPLIKKNMLSLVEKGAKI